YTTLFRSGGAAALAARVRLGRSLAAPAHDRAALVRPGDGLQRERGERADAGARGLPLRGAAGAGRRDRDGAAGGARGGGLPLVGPAGVAAPRRDGARAGGAGGAGHGGDRAEGQRRAALADAGPGHRAAVGGGEARADRLD